MKSLLPMISIAALMASGCAWVDELGKEKDYGMMDLTSVAEELNSEFTCVATRFPLEFWEFDADEPIAGNVRIRLYESLTTPILRNYAAINFVDINADTGESCPYVSELIGQTVDVSPNGCVRAQVQINTCDRPQTLNVIGSLTLTSFSTERKGWVEGTIEGTLSHSRKYETSTETKEIVTEIGQMNGKFAFVVHAGAIWSK